MDYTVLQPVKNNLKDMDQWPSSSEIKIFTECPQTSAADLSPVSGNNQVITDDIRFSIIDAICLKPGIWDSHREKTAGISRKDLFVDVAQLINRQFRLTPLLAVEDIEKHWKNLKDTYTKTKKKITYDQDGCPIRPKWKFYEAMMFLDGNFQSSNRNLRKSKRFSDDSQSPFGKRIRSDEDPDELDEYMTFCRSLYFPLKEIGFKNRIQFIKVQKSIRDMVHEAQMEVATSRIH